ncbi:MAG TPA: phosphomannomutase/phosphoglucomutase [Coxiellaceae bacterium]|nr:phosphomannomutase/phosphoglucomutase [Coxiellaceae bacterium]
MNTRQYQLPQQLVSTIFRAYDIRGLVGPELNTDVFYVIGLAIGSEALECNQRDVIVGRDGRLSGPDLCTALCDGILASGANVVFIGQVPSPVMYFATHHLTSSTGVIVTGSHNPAAYNGLKIVLKGRTLAADGIQKIYQRICKREFHQGRGSLSSVDVVPAYLKCIQERVHLTKPLRIVIDCGNGVAAETAPQLYRALGCEVTELYCEVDGNFPNHHPDPTVPENLKELLDKVQEIGADCGLAFDGDGDRLGLVTNQGEIIWPDRQMMLFAIDVLTRQPGAQIVFDVKCSSSLAKVIKDHGGEPLMWKTGHSLIKAKMAEIASPLAGEMSGHIFFKEGWFGFDDGVYVGARLLEIISRDGRSVSEIFKNLPNSINTPELKLDMIDEKKQGFLEALAQQADFGSAELITIDGLRVEFGYGWGLIRASNTTPCLTLRFEADNLENLQKIKAIFRRELLKLDSGLQIPF